ncbi:MAG TPA: thiamine pyrophosphate-binding protein [Verrucomicrobiae bacterium]|jgi:thiamine pyrophosphate-dependent acetolactate synthase large subunit-like protein|nr:thiamine pyrophosphate-binding protein [Verrucomicrobiae bacterium]
MKSTVARFIVELLKDAGVSTIFGVTGHSVFDITDAMYGDPEIRFVPALHEGSAAYMAAAYAKARRAPGVCLVSAGAGATNLLTGIAYAHKESIPLIGLSSDVWGEAAGKGASSWHEIPQREIFAPVVKMSGTLTRENAVESLREAFRLALTPRKGPVYIGVPRDVQQAEIDLPARPWAPPLPDRIAPDGAALRRAAEELNRAAAPVIIAGGGVHWAEAAAELKELAEILGAPFATTPSHKGLIAEDHPLALGALGFGAFPFAGAFAQEADCVLAIGTTFSEALTLGYGRKVIPENAAIIQIDDDAGEIGKIYPVRHAIVGDAKFALRGLIDLLKRAERKKDHARLQRLAGEKDAWRAKLASHEYGASGPIDQWHVYRALQESADEKTLVVGAGGTTELIRRFIAPAYAYHSGDFRAIGAGLATSIGLAFAYPGRPVACVTGDGSFMLETQELATAAREKLPITIIVVRNEAYGNMKRDQIRHWGGRVIGTDLNLPDFAALGAAYGVDTRKIERPAELRPAFARALALGKPSLLEVVCPIEGI